MKLRTPAIAAALLAVAVIGGFFYATRPIAPPSQTPPVAAESPAQKALPTGTSRFVIASEASKAEFTINEVLRGTPFTVVGTTDQVSGEIALDPQHPEAVQVGTIKVNARTLKTDNPQRNGMLGRFILKSEDPANEFMTFEPTDVAGLPTKIDVGTPFNFTIKGKLTISGVTREVTFAGAGQLADETHLGGAAEATVAYKDFNLAIPNVPFVAGVEDNAKLKISFTAIRAN